MTDIQSLVRPNILALKPYSCARDEFKGEAKAFLDANENPFNGPYNRYPDPRQWALKEKIARIKHVPAERMMLGNGSDEPIDLVYRIFCEPGVDNAVGIAPSYGMYEVDADINHVEYRQVPLDEAFQLHADALLAATDAHTKVIWICSPNNPSGNLMNRAEVTRVLEGFAGIVVIDEAYIDFADTPSWTEQLDRHPNLIVLQTFSKAWGLASVRCGMAFASEEIIGLFNKVKYPYNINLLTQNFVSGQLDHADRKEAWVKTLLSERTRLQQELQALPCVVKTHPTDANFILTQVKDANATYRYLVDCGIVTRNRNSVLLCAGCLRITVGTPEENSLLLEALKAMA
ncbi:MAG: histidinol-phosphate transaminase [Paludibacteraceae bacterium]|nr:histidinol-phosphate transaminase [Paludibacteraceae bacterium]